MKRLIVFVLAALLVASCISASYARVITRGDSVVKIGENINVGDDLRFKDLVAIRGNINVKGIVDKDVVAILGTVHLYPNAKVGGDVVAVGGNVIRDEGSRVGGDVVNIAAGKEGIKMVETCAPLIGIMAAGGFLLFKTMVFLGFIGLAMILVSFLTKQIGIISSKAESQWLNCLLWGILGIILICPMAFLLAITVVGIPLILVEFVMISVAMTMGYIAVAQIIGKRFTKAIRKPNQPMIVEVIWGLLLLFLVDLVPFAGAVIKLLAVIIGFGSAIVTKLGF